MAEAGESIEALPDMPSSSKRTRTFSPTVVSSDAGTSARGSLLAASRSSRPSSSDSRSHVPSITSSAFFRPMSSQKLQAHRGHRPISITETPQPRIDDEQHDTRSTTHRNSTGSLYTIKGGHALPRQEPHPAMPGTARSTSPVANWAFVQQEPSASLAREMSEDTPSRIDGGAPQSNPPHNLTSSPLNYGEAQPLRVTKESPPRPSIISKLTLNLTGQSQTRTNALHEKLHSGGSSAIDTHKPPYNPALGKNWEHYEGNSIFFFGGRLWNARDRPISIATAILVILPSGLFFGYSAPWLGSQVSAAVPFFYAYIFFICISSFLHASFSDPGVFPRRLHQFPPTEPNADLLALGPSTTRWEIVLSNSSAHGAMEVPTKYCKSCDIWRPPRCYHCRVCDACVETQDHHCVWLNNCVGRRNYRYFLTFVASGTILALYLMAASIAQIITWKNRNHATMGEAINRWRAPFAMFLYGLLAFPYPGSLWVYHILLMGWGRTTREYLNSRKFEKKDRHRPFTQGSIWRNWLVVLGRPQPQHYLRFSDPYQEGDQRFSLYKRTEKASAGESVEPKRGPSGVEMRQMQAPSSTFHPTRLKGFINRTPRQQLDHR